MAHYMERHSMKSPLWMSVLVREFTEARDKGLWT